MKKAISLIILISSLALCSCWNRREIDKLGILDSIVYDTNEDNIRVICEFLNPSSMGQEAQGNSEQKVVFSAVGRTGPEALRNITANFDERVFTSFVNVRFLTEKLAKMRYDEIHDFIIRDHEVRGNTFLVVLKGENTDKLYSCNVQLSETVGGYVRNILKAQSMLTSKSALVNTTDFTKAYLADGIEPVAPLAEVKIKQKELSGAEGSEKGGEQGGASQGAGAEEEKPEYELHFEGLAVFKGSKLVGYFDGINARAYNIILNTIKSGVLTTSSGGATSVYEIDGSKTDVKAKMKNDRVSIDITTKLNLVLKQYSAEKKIINEEYLKKAAAVVSSMVSAQLRDAVSKAQKEFKSDIFGFGTCFHRQNPREWKKIKADWNSYFEKADVKISVQATITRTGIIKDPVMRN